MSFAIKHGITEEEYLKGELYADVKHELIDGDVYAIAGASKNHQRIAINISRILGNFLLDSPSEPFSTGIKVKVDGNFFYPDGMVVCKSSRPTIILKFKFYFCQIS